MWKAFSVLKLKGEFKPRVDNLVFRLHYRYTTMLFLAGAILATLYDFVGAKIICMVDTESDSLKKVVDSYCYITGTYTVDRLQYGQVGVDMPHQGVGPHQADEAITYHTYYQWVPFVLVAQGALFYVPHLIWKRWENGLFRSVIQSLSIKDYLSSTKDKGGALANYFGRETQFEALAEYIRDSHNTHKGWAAKFIFCEILNVLVATFTVVFTNIFLGGEFFTYGIKVFSMSDMDPENRTDPMAQVFPRMGKCTFKMYGPSGTIERRDVMCLLPTNIANEKIYMMLWFWLLLLTVVGTVWLLLRLVTLVRAIRENLFMLRVYHLPRRNAGPGTPLAKLLPEKVEVRAVLQDMDFGDFVLLCQLGDNMEAALFSEFVGYMARRSASYAGTSPHDSGVDGVELDEEGVNGQETLPLNAGQGGAYPRLASLPDGPIV